MPAGITMLAVSYFFLGVLKGFLPGDFYLGSGHRCAPEYSIWGSGYNKNGSRVALNKLFSSPADISQLDLINAFRQVVTRFSRVPKMS